MQSLGLTQVLGRLSALPELPEPASPPDPPLLEEVASTVPLSAPPVLPFKLSQLAARHATTTRAMAAKVESPMRTRCRVTPEGA